MLTGTSARITGWLLGRVEGHRLVSLLLLVGSVPVAIGIDRVDDRTWLWVLAAVQVCFSLAIYLLGEWRAGQISRERTRARGETLLDVGHLLEPLVRELGRVAALGKVERKRERGSLRQAVLNAASGLSDAKLRANYFELAADGRAMLPVAATGRALPPKAGFFAGVKSGDTALAMVANDNHLFCDDTDVNPPPGWEPSVNREYRTFISVTVGTPGKPSGMLTLDAPEPGKLTEEDVKMLLVLGRILGIAEEITK